VVAAGLAVPQRSIVAPAWEQRVAVSQTGPSAIQANRIAPVPSAAAAPAPPPVERPARVNQGDDWRSNVFRGW
jgi:hypothetical protein